jgi:hypothetical protein
VSAGASSTKAWMETTVGLYDMTLAEQRPIF